MNSPDYCAPDYPAMNADRGRIAVGGIDINGRRDKFSNRAGSTPVDEVVAPRLDIFSTTRYHTYET
ncbi:hypothetical protein QUA00_14635 [Microcoleus sp. T2B6]|uniref:hypothetical protein n=1 Tax=unclassified Microcoleus TaxID=2642155 RepID=UPI002FD2F904